MKSVTTDPCFLYIHDERNNFQDIVCLQVEDSIVMRTKRFVKEEDLRLIAFQSKPQLLLADATELKSNGQYVWRKHDEVFLQQNGTWSECHVKIFLAIQMSSFPSVDKHLKSAHVHGRRNMCSKLTLVEVCHSCR